jgi:hypothetical protein
MTRKVTGRIVARESEWEGFCPVDRDKSARCAADDARSREPLNALRENPQLSLECDRTPLPAPARPQLKPDPRIEATTPEKENRKMGTAAENRQIANPTTQRADLRYPQLDHLHRGVSKSPRSSERGLFFFAKEK